MSKKKILYIITKSNWGGAQRYVYDLATSLPKEKFDVVVALGGTGALKEKLENAGIKVIQLSSLSRDISIVRDIVSFVEIYSLISKEKPDILHVNSSKAGGIGAFAGRLLQVPRIIFTLHGLASNEDRPLWQKKILIFFHWFTIVLSHMTIAVSQKIKNEVVFLPFIHKKITTIHNGVKEHDLQQKESARQALSLHNKTLINLQDQFWVGSVAELHKTKGLSYAIEAMRILAKTAPHIKYVVIGEGEERKHLESLIQKYQLQNNVFLLGFIENASKYLPAFDIFLLSSISEALGYAILEAGHAHLPVIATSVGGIPEIILNKKTGIVIPSRNAPRIAEAIEESAKENSIRNKLGDALNEIVLNVFSFKKMQEKTISVYNNHAL